MKNTLWHKRIPTLLGLLLILIGIGITTYLAGNGTTINIKAGPSEAPANVRITNITDSSFSISYTTEAQVVGSINYGENAQLEQTSLDDRDKNGKISSHFLHYITVKNLNPATIYYFSITSSNKTFMLNGAPYKISTGAKLISRPIENNAISGKIISPKFSKEVTVYISSEGSGTISTMVNDDGSYEAILDDLRNTDLSSYFDFNKNTVFNMLIQGPDEVSSVKFTAPPDGSLPQITLSENFDFTQKELENSSASAKESFSSLSLQPETVSTSPQIISPKKDQEFIDPQPRFTGIASPNSTVDIEIHSDDNVKAKITVDAKGNWSYRPPLSLSPGNHTITVYARDQAGILRIITQSFTIFESGTQIAEAATPSATPIPTGVPNGTLTPTVSPTQGGPTLTPSPTPTPIIIPTASISPTPPIEPPGNSLALLGILGIGIIGLGLLILLYNRGASL